MLKIVSKYLKRKTLEISFVFPKAPKNLLDKDETKVSKVKISERVRETSLESVHLYTF